MAETLHEMAVRMVKGEDGQPQCGKGCDKCPAGKLRTANGVCLVRRIAKVDNCEEQIKGLMDWAAEHPEPVRHGRWGAYRITGYDGLHPTYTVPCSACACEAIFTYRYCPNCGARMDEEDMKDGKTD